jgi:hypothetical protein
VYYEGGKESSIRGVRLRVDKKGVTVMGKKDGKVLKGSRETPLEASSWAFYDADAFEEATLGIVIQAEDADTTRTICGSSDLCKKLHKLRQTGQSRFPSWVHSAYPFTGRGWPAGSTLPGVRWICQPRRETPGWTTAHRSAGPERIVALDSRVVLMLQKVILTDQRLQVSFPNRLS